MKKIFKNCKGLSVVETAVAVGVFTVVVIGLVSVGSQSSVFSKRIDQTVQGSFLTQERLNSLSRVSFDALSDGAETDVRIDNTGAASDTGEYVRTTEVWTSHSEDENLSRVKVTVKKILRNMDGTLSDPIEYAGVPMYQETVFVNAGDSVAGDDEPDDHEEHDGDSESDHDDHADHDGEDSDHEESDHDD